MSKITEGNILNNEALLFHLMEMLGQKEPVAEIGIDIADSEAWNGIRHYHFFALDDGVVAFSMRGVYPDKRSIPGQWFVPVSVKRCEMQIHRGYSSLYVDSQSY